MYSANNLADRQLPRVKPQAWQPIARYLRHFSGGVVWAIGLVVGLVLGGASAPVIAASVTYDQKAHDTAVRLARQGELESSYEVLSRMFGQHPQQGRHAEK